MKSRVEFCQQFKSIQTLRNYQRKVTFRSVGCAVRVCLFALRLVAKADSPTPKLNVAASKIWRDKCFLTKFAFWKVLKWINRKNLSEKFSDHMTAKCALCHHGIFWRGKPQSLNKKKVNKWSHFSQNFMMVFSLRVELSLRFCFRRKMELLIRPIRHVARF